MKWRKLDYGCFIWSCLYIFYFVGKNIFIYLSSQSYIIKSFPWETFNFFTKLAWAIRFDCPVKFITVILISRSIKYIKLLDLIVPLEAAEEQCCFSYIWLKWKVVIFVGSHHVNPQIIIFGFAMNRKKWTSKIIYHCDGGVGPKRC